MNTRVTAGNLPHEVSSFIGRREELLEVRRLLSTARMVTLTGMGGVGKSRLALRVADRIRRSYPDGVWQVELSGLDDPVLLPQTLGAALGINDQSTRDPLDVLSMHLSRRRLLLLVDDCEHLVRACGSLFAELLRAAPGLQLLVTSREILGVAGEHVFHVAPLAVPNPADRRHPPALRVDVVSRYPSVALFVERARAVRPGFALTPDNVDIVSRVCHRLDGLPLAIELASARLRSLGVEDLDRRLVDRFALLTTHSSAVVPRHQTLRAAIGWSFTLCSKAERLLWKRASVFAGPFDLEAAESVCVADGLGGPEVLEALTGLIDKSVVSAEEQLGALQYRMLETVRLYGDDLLHAPAEASEVHHVSDATLRARHRDFYVELAERLNSDWFGPRQVQWSQRMHAELPNLRAALGFCLAEPGGSTLALRLAGALQYFWWGCGEAREGRLWLERALAGTPRRTAEWVRAMTAFCRLLGVQGQRAAALRPGWACLDAARQLGEPFLLVEALAVLALNLLCVDRTTTALPLLDEALELAQGIPEVPQALASATLFRGIGAVFDGDLGLARRLLADCQTQCRRHGDLLYLGYALDSSVLVALRSGQAEQAGVLAREAVAVHDSLGDTLGLCLALEFMAWIADAGRDHRRAARMLGATEAQARLLGGSPFSINGLSTTHRACEASARAALGEAAFQAQFRLGEELSANDLIVRDDVAALPAEPTGAHCSELPELTRREVEIAALVARGLSNRDIAGQLVIAQRTAEGHVRNILLKLGFTSRSQIAVWYTKQA